MPRISFLCWRRQASNWWDSSGVIRRRTIRYGAARRNKIYLLRDYQRRGLGKRMVAAAVTSLLEHGLTSMALFTEVDNEPACNFYRNER